MSARAPSLPDRDVRKGRINELLRAQVIKRIQCLRHGIVEIYENGEMLTLGEQGDTHTIHVYDPRFWRSVALGGGTGAGEAYIKGFWDCEDITGLLQLLLRNRELLSGMDSGVARLGNWAANVWHALNRNSVSGSKRNIAAHYDLGNEFFRLFLDKDLQYSSALFDDPNWNLEQAQRVKLRRICETLTLRPGHSVVEIGTGWGGFAIFAAREYGCHVTTTTISREQFELATRRVKEAGLEDRITLLQQDYRDLTGSYDRLVSIEMIEAIGHQYLDAFMTQCARLLKPDGAMLLQAITIEDHRYETALKQVDYIKRFVFPGCFIPSTSAILKSASHTGDLRLLDMRDIGPSYAETLKAWRERFEANRDAVRALGYPEHFVRLWRFYLCYCEAGFRECAIGDAQMLLARPGFRRKS